MNVIFHFTLRSLKHNRKWTTVTILGLIISTAMLTAVSTFYSSFMSLMIRETIYSTGNWHGAILGVTVEDAQNIGDEGFVQEAMLRHDLGYAQLQNSKNSGKPYLFIRELDQAGQKNFNLKIISGRLPQNGNEIVLPEHLESNGGVSYDVGDTLTLSVGQRLSPDGQELWQNSGYYKPDESSGEAGGETFKPQLTKTYRVVGIVERPGFEYSWSPGYTAITGLDLFNTADQKVDVLFLAKRIGTELFDNVYDLAKQYGINNDNVLLNKELLRYYGVVESDNVQQVLNGFLGVIVAIIIAASVSLIYNAFAISVSERTRQLGLLASVGATKAQKRFNVYLEGLLISVIGIPLGILAGIAGIGITLRAIQPLMQSFSHFSTGGLSLVVTPWSILISAALAILTVFISAWIPAMKASGIMPVDAIRQSKEIKLSSKKVRTSPLTRWLFGFEGEIALKNLKRSRKKYRVTVISLIVSLVLFLTVSYYAELSGSAEVLLAEGYNFDIAVSYSGVKADEAAVVSRKISDLDGVTKSTLMKEIAGSSLLSIKNLTKQSASLFQEEPVRLYTQLVSMDDTAFDAYLTELGLNAEEYRNQKMPRVIAINQAKGILNKKYSTGSILTMNAGDTITFEYQPSEEGLPVEVSLEIGLLTDRRPMGVLIQQFSNLVLVTSEESFTAVAQQLPDTDWMNNQYLFLNCKDPENLEETIRTQAKGISTGNISLMNIVTMTRSEQNVITFLGIFVYGFIILISLISIANIANTTSTNMSLRRKEFAMLRSVGMTPKSFNRMIRYESILYGLKALLYGLPISAAITFWLHQMQQGTFDFGFVVPWKSYLAAVVLIFMIVAITMFYAIGKIQKENIIEALKMENE